MPVESVVVSTFPDRREDLPFGGAQVPALVNGRCEMLNIAMKN